MAEHIYKYLTAEERLAMLRPRLQDSERQHYEAKLNSNTHPNYDKSIMTGIETRIAWLQGESDKLEAETTSSAPRESSKS